MDEWERFRKAWERRKGLGLPTTLTESGQSTESHGSPDTNGGNVPTNVSDSDSPKESSTSIIIGLNPRALKISYARLAAESTNARSVRRKRTAPVHTWFCVVCGAENPSVGRDGETIAFCLKCGRSALTISDKARAIFGSYDPNTDKDKDKDEREEC